MTVKIGRAEYYLEVNMREERINVPIIDIIGKHPGTTLVLVAGLHGDEYEATQTLFRLSEELDPSQLHGRVISIPVANPLAHRAQSRTSPRWYDGANLARSFPGDANGTETFRIAQKLWEFIVANCGSEDLLIDLHSGGQHYSYAQIAGVRELHMDSVQTAKSIQAARAMLIEQLWFMDPTPGTLSTVAIESGIPSIGCEMEGRGGLNEKDVEKYLAGLRNVMKLTGHSWDGVAESTMGEFSRTITVTSKYSGFASLLPITDSHVEAGELLCRIVNSFGHVVEEIFSPCAGVIWARRTNPSVGEEEIIALVQIKQ